jgi:hypothetical protein
MNDLDLLVMAAKAAGYSQHPDGGCEWLFWVSGAYVKWNPLEDDGDALRLAVRLDLRITSIYRYFDEHRQCATTVERSGGGMIEDLVVSFPSYTESFTRYDPYAATRRAIVLAAAEIGKAIK